MASRRIQDEIDTLYQLAPDEFTAARNLLAKQAGADGPQVRALVKPPIPAWAVNQLYWKRREDYDALIEAATELRQTHKAILAGRRGDLRAASKAHEAALDAAGKAAIALLQESGHPVTDATRQGILTTLRALPAGDPPGRLSRVLQPGGFEMLAGLSIGRGKDSVRVKAEPVKAAPALKEAEPRKGKAGKAAAESETLEEKRAREQARARAQEEVATATRELREAEHTARREEFEAARASRDAEKSARQVELAREAVEAAQQALAEAEAASEITARSRQDADARATEANRVLEEARSRVEAATTRLNGVR
jgi:hypothetical protein